MAPSTDLESVSWCSCRAAQCVVYIVIIPIHGLQTGGTEISVDEILQKYEDNKSFYKNGGLTVTGGEPLLQIDFLTELFMKAKAQGIHTCIDTSGIVFKPDNKTIVDKMDVLMQYTDLVMLDIKHIDPEEHLKLCSQPNDGILAYCTVSER